MRSTTKPQITDAEWLAKPHHLVTAESQGKPICGDASSDAVIGSCVEHLDDKREFVREVFGKGGKPATACQQCLELYPSLVKLTRDSRELKRITPFNVRVNLAFSADTKFGGYRVSANGIADIDDKHVVVGVFPMFEFTTAKCLYSLKVDLYVDAPLVVQLLNKANKDE